MHTNYLDYAQRACATMIIKNMEKPPHSTAFFIVYLFIENAVP